MNIVKCKECGNNACDKDRSCPNCGKPMPVYNSSKSQTNYSTPSYQNIPQTPAYTPPAYVENSAVCCPRCGSTQVSANKKGFSGVNAVGGVLLTGGIGLLAGTIGSNKLKITCLSCGNVFNPGDNPTPTVEPTPFNPVLFTIYVVFLLVIMTIVLLIIT